MTSRRDTRHRRHIDDRAHLWIRDEALEAVPAAVYREPTLSRFWLWYSGAPSAIPPSRASIDPAASCFAAALATALYI